MSEESSVVTMEKPKKKRRSLWWLWLLLILVVFAGGIVLGLKLTTMPLPYDIMGRYFPGVLETQNAAVTAPVPTEAPLVTETPAPLPVEAAPAAEEKEETAVQSEEEKPAALEGKENAAFAGKYIGVDAALKAALERAKVTEEDAAVSGVVRTKDEDGQPVYEVSFSVGKIDYQYTVNALTGEIESWSMSNFSGSANQTFSDSAIETFDAPADKPEQKEETIDIERATEIAYKDAGVKDDEVYRILTNIEKGENGDVYRISFRTLSGSYVYRISAQTGEILDARKP